MTMDQRIPAVLFAAGWWPGPNDPHAGIFIREQALAVQALRPVAVVHGSLEKKPWAWPSIRLAEENDEGMAVVRFRISTPLRRFGIHKWLGRSAYKRALRRLERRFRFQCLHIHVRTPITESAVHVAAQRQWPVLVTEHSSFYHRGIGLHAPRQRLREQSHVARWFSHPSIQAVLPVSMDLGQILHERFGVPEHRIAVVPNVANPVFHPRTCAPPPPFRILLAARWEPPKDAALFLRALELLPASLQRPDALHIFWAGDGSQYDLAVRDAAQWAGNGTIRFLGRLRKEDLADLLSSAHLLVHPTTAENLPCIILESLACGTPVLSHAVNGIPELIDGTNGVLCPPGDAATFADALRRIMEGPDRFDRERIARDAALRFAPAQVARQILQVHDRVLRPSDASGISSFPEPT